MVKNVLAPLRGITILAWQLLIVFLMLLVSPGFSQDQTGLHLEEDSLQKLSMAIVEPLDDASRRARNQQFSEYFEKVLQNDPALSWPFDSLRAVAIQNAPDRSFRIITWYVPLRNGEFEYHGFVQVAPGPRQDARLYPLNDQTRQIRNPAMHPGDHHNWFGAWYYELIHNRYQGTDHYVLLGWKGKDPMSRQRLIESFALTPDGPVFGLPVFDTGNSRIHRVVFEYSARVAMSLKYESHPPRPGQRPQHMIVFDRLAPTHESLRGHFQHYMPEVNIFDAFLFEQGRWVFTPDVDARTSRR